MKIPIKNRPLRGVVSTITFLAIITVAFWIFYGVGLIFVSLVSVSPASGWLVVAGESNPFLIMLMGVLAFCIVGLAFGVVVGICSGISKLYNNLFDP